MRQLPRHKKPTDQELPLEPFLLGRQGGFHAPESDFAYYSRRVGRAYMLPRALPPPVVPLLHVPALPAAPAAAVLLPPGQPLRSRLLVDLPATGGGQLPLLQRGLPLFALL